MPIQFTRHFEILTNIENSLGKIVSKIRINDIICIYYISPGNELIFFFQTEIISKISGIFTMYILQKILFSMTKTAG